MLDSLLVQPDPIYFLIVVFVLSLLALTAGYFAAVTWRKTENDRDEAAFGLGQAAIFGLIALLLAFSFSFAADRFEQRRALVVDEADAVGTAYAQIDFMPATQATAARALMRKYVAARLDVYAFVKNPWEEDRFVTVARTTEDRLWTMAAADVRNDPKNLAYLALARGFDTMGDVANEETAAINNHVPVAIVGMVVLCTLLGAALLGLTFGRVRAPNRAVSVIFCVLFAATVFTIVDLDHPRGGLLTIDVAPLQNALNSMNQP